MLKRQREERTANPAELEARKKKLKEFARERLESSAQRGNGVSTAAQPVRPSREILQAIEDEQTVSIGSVYRSSPLPSSRTTGAGNQRSWQARPPDNSKRDISNTGCSDVLDIGTEDCQPNFKAGTVVLVRNVETNYAAARGTIRAVIHGGYSSAKYDIALSSRGGDRVMAHWKDVALADPEERSGRDTARSGGSGDVDIFGRKIPPPKKDTANDMFSTYNSISQGYAVCGRDTEPAVPGGLSTATIVDKPHDISSSDSSSAPIPKPDSESNECVVNTNTVLKKSGGWRNRGSKPN